jgi:predicted helicase
MSQTLINQYLNQLASLKKVSGSFRESVLRDAFKDLLKAWGRQHDLTFIPEYALDTLTKEKRYVDGALLYSLRVPFGYWEAKDTKDDLDAEIEKKFKRGYPQDNIIFDDTVTAVLIQNKREVIRVSVEDVEQLSKLLKLFFSYERVEISQFNKAVGQFKQDLPAVLAALREMIEAAYKSNKKFVTESQRFLVHAQEAINPSLIAADVREMLIQHILTEEIFATVFPNTSFHRENNIARELYKLESTFFTGNTKFQSLKALEPYYAAIRAAASQIERHHEKQAFLKALYENFYKVYNVKAADRLGVVYTPNEIVRFMIESADWLCEKHFNKNLIDKNVEILDPATGTGTFICELLEHFRGQPAKLKHKYEHELHANEVAILPYYVANLNIEATYAAIMDEYREFENLCFVDTLDNVGLHTAARGSTAELFGSVTEENVARIKRQNSKKISVIIGNPPYNANQLNENDNNKNREYPSIDKRIKATYIAESTAQKTKLYDMYARFFRWASDRLDANGVLAFITNRSFIESRTFDGFRKVVAEEFSEIYVVDLGGDVRANPKLSGTKHNVFGIQTGVAISFFVKREKKQGCRVHYVRRPEMETAEEKLSFISDAKIAALNFEEITADKKGNWVNQSNNDFDSLMSIASKETKAAMSAAKEKAIFKLFSLGVATNRDDWVYDFNKQSLKSKTKFFCDFYKAEQLRWKKSTGGVAISDFVNRTIKWTSELEAHLIRGSELPFSEDKIRISAYRPYTSCFTYFAPVISHRMYQQPVIFPSSSNTKNTAIVLPGFGAATVFGTLATNQLPDLHFFGDSNCLPLYVYRDDERTDNITDWALKQFQQHYANTSPAPAKAGAQSSAHEVDAKLDPGLRRGRAKNTESIITKEAIFHYVYAVLHDPIYREKYALNLKREFPRIPFYGSTEADFKQWADWGKTLMDLHIGYESVTLAALTRTDTPDEKARKHAGKSYTPKAILKADKAAGRITLDTETTLDNIPDAAWEYKLGNRCALEWILDQYKEKKPKDPTIREKFDTYRFADYKEKVIDLLMRVTTVSVQTQAIVGMMKASKRL